MDITKEMQELISKSLPAATANAMREFIEKANVTAEELRVLKGKYDEQSVKLLAETKETGRLRIFEQKDARIMEKAAELIEREKVLDATHRTLKMEIMQTKLDMMEATNITVRDLVSKVFGHPSVTVSTFKDVLSVPSDSGMYPNRDSLNETTTTTESKE